MVQFHLISSCDTSRSMGTGAGGARGQKRGVAMLLVVISMLMATVLTTAYLASRDNSAAIGENVSSTTSARWAADTGIELAIAALQTEKNWRSLALAQNGRIVTNYSISGGTANVDVFDLITGFPPGAQTEYVRLVSTGRVGDIDQVSSATAYVPLDAGRVMDVDLSEFAAFVSNSLSLTGNAVITRWPMAPLSVLGRRVAIGTQATNASSISLGGTSAALDVTVFHPTSASSSLVSNITSLQLLKSAIIDPIPFPQPPSCNETHSLLSLAVLVMNGGTATITTDSRYLNAELKNNCVRTLRGDVSMIVDGTMRINSGSKLIIDGNVKLVVFGELELDTGSIELKNNARLRLYMRGDSGSALRMRDGYIGNLRSNSVRDNTGRAAYADPQLVSIMSIAPPLVAPEWRIERNSVIKGTIYAPHPSRISIIENSAVYGRIATKSLEMSGNAALFYDPSLDSRCGYSNLDSVIYDNSDRILSSVRTLASLEANTLQSVADSTGYTVKSDLAVKVIREPTSSTSVSDDTPITEPTPRTVRVEYDLVSFGNNVKNWE